MSVRPGWSLVPGGVCAAGALRLGLAAPGGYGRLGYDVAASTESFDDVDGGGGVVDDASDADPTAPPPVDAGSTGEVSVSKESADARGPTLVWTGQAFLLVWDDDRHGDTELYLARLDASAVARGAPRQVGGGATGSVETPERVWTGATYGLAWADDRSGNWDVYFRQVVP